MAICGLSYDTIRCARYVGAILNHSCETCAQRVHHSACYGCHVYAHTRISLKESPHRPKSGGEYVRQRLPPFSVCDSRVRLHWSHNQHLSGHTSQTRVATFNPTCVSILIATQVLIVLSRILYALQQVSDQTVGSQKTHFVGVRQSG